jgi:predicted ATPase with chaperone activity
MGSDILSRLASRQTDSAQASEAETSRPEFNLACDQPLEPQTVEEMGIPEAFIEDMILKFLALRGAMTEHQLSWFLKCPKHIVAAITKDLSRRKLIGPPPSNPLAFICGSEGKIRAEDANNTTRYLGPIPITVEDYITKTRQQVGRPLEFSQKEIDAAYSKIVMYDQEFRDRIGPAVRSQRSILLYGAPGNGKTITGKCLTALMKSDLMIPYAIFAHGQVIKFFDPSVHKQIIPDEYKEYDIDKTDAIRYDERWTVVKTPYVEVATEFTLEGFELSYNTYAKFYEMAMHIKANGGVFFIDDFGRQRGKAEEYLNRLITPLQSREDILKLSMTGGQIRVPYFCIPLFSTNFTLDRIGDEAFLRRFKYKILARSPKENDLAEIFKFECMRSGIDFNPPVYQHFLKRMTERGAKLRSCLANDILSKIIDHCAFHGLKPEMSEELVNLAFDLNFSEQTETWAFGTQEDKK